MIFQQKQAVKNHCALQANTVYVLGEIFRIMNIC